MPTQPTDPGVSSPMPTEAADARASASDLGSASLLAIGVAFVLLGGCLAGVLWAAISIAHHRADAAADLTALTAAQSLQTGSSTPCAAAEEIAKAHQVELHDCQQQGETISVVVAVKLDLGAIGTPVLTGQARAGPIEGAN
ncbi:Rv3654c family TadE-like protein [Kribbella sp. NPDC056861]|uniref:Rv3654c family TadE-like protein n=1 Tax=Kribbella sp. NPDC056861 TaxID=3154857 RepID=UPI0034145D48